MFFLTAGTLILSVLSICIVEVVWIVRSFGRHSFAAFSHSRLYWINKFFLYADDAPNFWRLNSDGVLHVGEAGGMATLWPPPNWRAGWPR